MFRFENPIFLWLLLVIPVLAILRFWGWRQRRRK
ncbi:MAG: BatA domain-containing protein, partial [Prevotella sp.]|nr:BatA domain-containing protein [Prevotella sp.]